jgi:hypothetical protein
MGSNLSSSASEVALAIASILASTSASGRAFKRLRMAGSICRLLVNTGLLTASSRSSPCPHRGCHIASKLAAVAIQALASLARTSVPARLG